MSESTSSESPLLQVDGLSVDYVTERGNVRGIDRLSLTINKGEVVGVAGESGSGKSTLAKAIMRILPPPAVISAGEVHFEGKNVLLVVSVDPVEHRRDRC